MIVFLTLLLGHLIADFPLQTNSVFQLKTRSTHGLLIHTSIHVLVAAILLLDPLGSWSTLLFLGSMHFLTDWTKLRIRTKYETPGFVLDQLAHVTVLAFIGLNAPDLALRPMPAWFLGLALGLALMPAVGMFLWILGRDLKLYREGEAGLSQRPGGVLLNLTQRGGLLFVTGLSLTWLMIT